MASLGSHINVWETCLQLMDRLGYELEATFCIEEGEEGMGTWFAMKDGFDFAADDPIQLLGLVAIHEDVRPEKDEPYWWRAKTVRTKPDLFDQLVDRAIAVAEARVAELAALRESDPRAWEAEVREAFDNVGIGDVDNAAGYLEIHPKELRRMLEDPLLADLKQAAETEDRKRRDRLG